MKTLFLSFVSLIVSLPAFATQNGEISRVSDLPSSQINCALLFRDRGTMAHLKLEDGGDVDGAKYLRGQLTLKRNGIVVQEENDLTVLISKDLGRITAGHLSLGGLDMVPSLYLLLTENSMMSHNGLIGYSGAVAVKQAFALDTAPASNSACAFARR